VASHTHLLFGRKLFIFRAEELPRKQYEAGRKQIELNCTVFRGVMTYTAVGDFRRFREINISQANKKQSAKYWDLTRCV
jgi:hypothetical protein